MRRSTSTSAIPILMLIGASVVAVVAFLTIGHSRNVALRNGDAIELLAEIRADANHHNAAEWRAMAEGRVGGAALRELDAASGELRSKIARLGELGHADHATRVLTALEGYLAAVELEFGHLAAARTEEAERVDAEQVDPGFDRLGSLIAHAEREARGEKITAGREQTIAFWAIGSISLLVVAALLVAFARMRQRAAVDGARHEALEGQMLATQQLAAEHERDANHDALTGLPNRRHFLRRLEEEVAKVDAGAGHVAVLLIDLNRFKDVNDTLGHVAGDDILGQVGPRLRAALRGGDFLARLGGDEFALLVHATEDATADGALNLADRIHMALEPLFLVEGLPLPVSASIGIALGPEHGDRAETLLRHADVAMYRAKEAGLGSVLYASDADSHSRDQLQLAGELRAAFSAGEIVLHYQPKVNLVTGEVIGVEALVRWQHPRRGLLHPQEFLPVAAGGGMMRRLTSYVLDEALAQAGAWAGEGIDLRMAVNLSVIDLLDDALPDEIATLLERHGVDGARLQLEVTENVLLTAPERVAEIVARLAHHGVTLSLDDFGVGYSSLAHLRGLMVDEIKIDRLFVTNILTNAFDSAVVRSTVGLGHSLGLRVVAEGVETAETLDELHAQGCDEAQGYYIRRPGPADELTPWLRRRLGVVLNAR